jgi:hypothetical protein
MRRAMILFFVCMPLLFGFSTMAMAFDKKVTMSECFTATW